MDIQAYIQSGVIESYVLGLASAEEIAEVDRMRVQHPEVEQAINDFSTALEDQLLENAIPPPDVKHRILQAIKEEEGFASDGETNGEFRGAKVIKIGIWRTVAAAAVILLVISGGINFYLYDRLDKKNADYQALLSERNSLYANNEVIQTSLRNWQQSAEMMVDPAMAVVKMTGAGLPGKEGGLATLLWDTRSKDVYVMPNHLPRPEAGKQYQLWALVDGKPVDAGVFDMDCNGVCKMKNIPKAQGFAVTLEKAGGSPTPSLDQMYVKGGV